MNYENNNHWSIKIGKEAVMAYFRMLSFNLPGQTEGTYENLQSE